jgi:hypothetical protein
MSARQCCGDVNPPEIFPIPGMAKTTQNRVLIMGRAPSFRNDKVSHAASGPLKRYQDTELA